MTFDKPSARVLTEAFKRAEINGRPMTSHEVQKYLGRMPTRQERSAFSHWRNANPNVDLETGEIIDRKKVYEDENRFMPRSWHIKQELQELLPGRAERICDLIEQLIEAMLQERGR